MFRKNGSHNALDEYVRLTAAYMRRSDLRVVNLIGNPSKPDRTILDRFADADGVTGVFYYNYDVYYSDYAEFPPYLRRQPARAPAAAAPVPVMGARYYMWTGCDRDLGRHCDGGRVSYSPKSLAAQLMRAAVANASSWDGYSLVAVNIWDYGPSDVVQAVSALDRRRFYIADPETFVERIASRVR